MKKNQKTVDKIIDKVKPGKSDDKPKGQITTANIEEHREKTLESGRKFKYPTHVSMHKILITAAIIFVVALIGFVTFSWWRLYKVQDTSDFFYTATRVIPIPVAHVDGEPVLYGDYMRRLRASIYYLENQDGRDLTIEDGQRELEYTRRYNMDEAQKVAFARKITREKGLEVTSEMVDANIETTLNAGSGGTISSKAYENSLRRYFGWSMDDYRRIVHERLLLREASFAIDDEAQGKADEIKRRLNVGEDFATVAKEVSDDFATKESGGDVGSVNINNVDQNGLIAVARSMTPGQISDVIRGVDAFYIIKLTDKTETTVKYSQIRVGLNEFNKQFAQLREDGKITECIEIE